MNSQEKGVARLPTLPIIEHAIQYEHNYENPDEWKDVARLVERFDRCSQEQHKSCKIQHAFQHVNHVIPPLKK
jgi:hypothetical protein